MAIIEVIRREEGPYNPGTPGTRAKAAVNNADNFVRWLKAKGWEQVEDSTEDSVRLENTSPLALRTLSEYGSKPQLRNGKAARRVADSNG